MSETYTRNALSNMSDDELFNILDESAEFTDDEFLEMATMQEMRETIFNLFGEEEEIAVPPPVAAATEATPILAGPPAENPGGSSYTRAELEDMGHEALRSILEDLGSYEEDLPDLDDMSSPGMREEIFGQLGREEVATETVASTEASPFAVDPGNPGEIRFLDSSSSPPGRLSQILDHDDLPYDGGMIRGYPFSAAEEYDPAHDALTGTQVPQPLPVSTPEEIAEALGQGSWYMVEDESSSDLQHYEIPHINTEFGAIFESSLLSTLVQKAELDWNMYEMVCTDYTNLKKFVEMEVFEVSTYDSWNCGVPQREKFQEATERILVPVVKSDVSLFVPHGYTKSPHDQGDEKFWVCIYSAPENNENMFDAPRTIFGIDLEGSFSSYGCSGLGVPIADEAGYEVAELVGRTLYIHTDICHMTYDSYIELYERILQETVAILIAGYDFHRELVLKELPIKTRKKYIEACGNRISGRIKSLKSDISEASRKLIRAQETIAKSTNSRRVSNRLLIDLEKHSTEDTENYGAEYDKLMEHPRLTSFNFKAGWLCATTDDIFINFNDCIYAFGKYEIKLALGSGSIRIFNLDDNAHDGYQHPHIDGGGSCCLGNLSEGIGKLMGECEYSIVLDLIFQYLESVNENDMYHNILHWDHLIIGTGEDE